jgi:carbonic anhydrase/acetyltransferase-like protein (isoleucine patch superfamily)
VSQKVATGSSIDPVAPSILTLPAHGAVLHGCTIGPGCLVGMNATVLNGAVIGNDSLIAAGALVLEGAAVPPRSLVAGVPGRVRREVTDAEIASSHANAEHYRRLRSVHAEANSAARTVDRERPEPCL